MELVCENLIIVKVDLRSPTDVVLSPNFSVAMGRSLSLDRKGRGVNSTISRRVPDITAV